MKPWLEELWYSGVSEVRVQTGAEDSATLELTRERVRLMAAAPRMARALCLAERTEHDEDGHYCSSCSRSWLCWHDGNA